MEIRKDFFLIWGHGIIYEEKIIDLIEKNKNFKIEYFFRYKTNNIKKLISNVYFNDYTPIYHLKNKTKYLNSIDNKEVLFIFCTNRKPKEIKVKSFNKFHIESLSVNSLKNSIRRKFNPKKKGKISHDHVIHGSDNQNQTEHVIKFLSNRNLDLEKIYSINDHNFNYQKCIKLKKVPIKKIKARILKKNNKKIETKIISLDKTPHFSFVKDNKKYYKQYLNKFRGIGLNYYYSIKKFSLLIKNFKYLGKNNENSYIKVKKEKNSYIISDGLHRASILKFNKINKVIIEEEIY